VSDSATSSAGLALSPASKIIFAVVAVLSVGGMIVSGISLQRHYAKSETQFCEFGEKFNCDIVNRSEYSSIVGIPVAAIGLAGYGLLFGLSTFYRARPETPTRLLLASLAGLAFALRLTYIEGYVLTTWCVLCLISLALIFLISGCAATVRIRA
jgi:uncharacterized membrane protein